MVIDIITLRDINANGICANVTAEVRLDKGEDDNGCPCNVLDIVPVLAVNADNGEDVALETLDKKELADAIRYRSEVYC
jgi:hypothetical protein